LLALKQVLMLFKANDLRGFHQARKLHIIQSAK